MAEHIPALLLGSDPALLAELRIQLSGLDAATVVCREGGFDEGARLARENPPDIIMVVMDGDARRGVGQLVGEQGLVPHQARARHPADDAGRIGEGARGQRVGRPRRRP